MSFITELNVKSNTHKWAKIKKPYKLINLQGLRCAQDWIRTSTPLRALRPEHSASTNFATWASVSGVANIYTTRFSQKQIYSANKLQPLISLLSTLPNTSKLSFWCTIPASSVAIKAQLSTLARSIMFNMPLP